MDSKDEDGGSYRLATTGDPVDDGRTPDGRPKALRYKKAPHQSKKQAMDDLKQECDLEEHKLSIDVLCTQLQTDPELGLTPEQARDILLRDGPNALTPPKKTSEWVKFSKNLFGGFAMLLWVGAFLCFIAYAIQSSSSEEVPDDNVSSSTISLSLRSFCFSVPPRVKRTMDSDDASICFHSIASLFSLQLVQRHQFTDLQ